MTDLLGPGDHAPDDWQPEETDHTWGHPATLAFTAFPLALLNLFGAQVLRGGTYSLLFASTSNGSNGSPQLKSYVLAGAFLSAAFTVVPLVLAMRGLRRLVPSDAAWVGPVLRASVVLSGLALVLRLVLAVIVLFQDDSNGLFLYGYTG